MSLLLSLARPRKFLSPVNLSVLGAALALSFSTFVGISSAFAFAEIAAIGIASIAMILYPEFALAAFLLVGDVKGDPRIAALFPFDLTLAVAAILIAGIVLNLLRGKRVAPMPRVYFLFMALVAMMAASLIYTPVLSAGVQKLELFVTITAIAIVGAFFCLPDPAAMKRFLWCFGGAAYAICLASLSGLGGHARLVTPSENTIGLGRIASVLATLIWFALVPGAPLRKRLLAYAAMAVPLIAMVGAGSRGSVIAFALLIIASLFFYRRLVFDVVALTLLGAVAIPFLDIPQASFRYLGSLLAAQSVSGLLDFRADLLRYGWELLKQHPLLGAGIAGFRYSSPNPGLYKWPHDIFLELACELGIPAALIAGAIFAASIREAANQLRDTVSAQTRFSMIAAGFLFIGLVTAVTTGNINSDRSIWLFISLVFVIGTYCREARAPIGAAKQIFPERPSVSVHAWSRP